MSLYVLRYESADDVMTRAAPVYPAHRERLQAFKASGDLLMVGTFADPQQDGSMAIFGSRQAAESFVEDDPFVREGVVHAWSITEWFESAGDL